MTSDCPTGSGLGLRTSLCPMSHTYRKSVWDKWDKRRTGLSKPSSPAGFRLSGTKVGHVGQNTAGTCNGTRMGCR
jgi:hypothetical protein